MKARFLADANLRSAIVRGFRKKEPSAEFFPTAGLIPDGMPDPDVLTLAASMDCLLVSHDLETMPGHFYTFLESSNSPGAVLLAQSVTTGHAIAEIQIAWHCLKADDFKNRILYLP